MINVTNAFVSSSATGGTGGFAVLSVVPVSTAVARWLKQPVSLANRQQSLPLPLAELEVRQVRVIAGNGGSATLSSGGLGPAVFGSSASGGTVTVSGTAIGGTGGVFAFVSGNGAPVSLLSNGGVNDAVGGATSGALNITQTAIGGQGGGVGRILNNTFGGNGGSASSTLIGMNPYGASSYNLTSIATGGRGGNAAANDPGGGGSAAAFTAATSFVDGGSVTAFSRATAGNPGIPTCGGPGCTGIGGGNSATANATAINNGISGVANADANAIASFGAGGHNDANATADSSATNGGTATSTANATAGGAGGLFKGGDANAIANSNGSTAGSATATATAGSGGFGTFFQQQGFAGGAATASANITSGGPAVATATGGNGASSGSSGPSFPVPAVGLQSQRQFRAALRRRRQQEAMAGLDSVPLAPVALEQQQMRMPA